MSALIIVPFYVDTHGLKTLKNFFVVVVITRKICNGSLTHSING